MGNTMFKSVAFGGFDKQDVIGYIEKTAQESAAVQAQLQQENESLRSELEELRSRLDTAEDELARLRPERERFERELKEERAARQVLEPLREESRELKKTVEQLRPDAEAYAQFRERIGAIECEARKRAADLEEATISTLMQVITQFQSQYQTLMTTFEGTAAQVTGELRKVEVNLAQLPRAMDRSGTDLKELEAALTRAREKLDT